MATEVQGAARDLENASPRAKELAKLVEAYGSDFTCASSILAEALKKVSAEREAQADLIRLYEEDLATSRLLYSETVIAERELLRLLRGDLFTGQFGEPDKVEAEEVAAWVSALHARHGPALWPDRMMDPLEILVWETMGATPVPSEPPPSPEVVPSPAPTKRTLAGRKGQAAGVSGRKALALYKETRGLH